MTEIVGVGVGIWALMLCLGLWWGWAWRRASDRAAAMNRHPAAQSRGRDCSLLTFPRPERELPTGLGADGCCDDCGWPFLSYEHYTECRR
jgi:hypothetical protein